jgi:hypothetical protein
MVTVPVLWNRPENRHMTDRRRRTYAEIRDRRERTPEEQAFDCRVNRIVDAWVTQYFSIPYRHPRDWSDAEWILNADLRARGRKTDPPVDAAMRAAVIAEIDAIATALERRRSA